MNPSNVSSTMLANAAGSIRPPKNGVMTRTANSGYSRPCISRISAASKRGQDSGKYKPPSLASPASRTSSNSSVGASPRVLMYCTLSSLPDDGLTYPPRQAQASAPQSLQRTSPNMTLLCRRARDEDLPVIRGFARNALELFSSCRR